MIEGRILNILVRINNLRVLALTHRCECVRWYSLRANLKKWLRDENGLGGGGEST